jgi:hypothetical protein
MRGKWMDGTNRTDTDSGKDEFAAFQGSGSGSVPSPGWGFSPGER